MATETNVSERIKRAEKHVNEQLSYGGISPATDLSVERCSIATRTVIWWTKSVRCDV